MTVEVAYIDIVSIELGPERGPVQPVLKLRITDPKHPERESSTYSLIPGDRVVISCQQEEP
jgi:hypothetical protein